MFVAEPLSGFYVTPMIDFTNEGLTSLRLPEGGQPFDLSQSDDSTSFILAVARRDTESEARAKLRDDRAVFNYGLHFTYRTQRNDPVGVLGKDYVSDGINVSGPPAESLTEVRDAQLFMPDLWAKYEKKKFRIELEFASIFGSLRTFSGAGADDRRLNVWQFGAVLQGEYKLLNGDLELGGELGFASGDEAPGFGNYPRRRGSGTGTAAAGDAPAGATRLGDVDGPQFACSSSTTCTDRVLRNFRFNRGYRTDMILYREILGGITDSFYIKPRINYRITQGFNVFGAAIYSRAIFPQSVPGARLDASGTLLADTNLGLELNAGVRYETEDGFFAQLQYGVLFPFGGFAKLDGAGAAVQIDSAQALRGQFGIKF
jgi:uncharacterized protein (TIGR04551 family)